MNEQEKAVVVEVLCGQALADHLGDVRDAEEKLWTLLDAPKLPIEHPAWDEDEAWPMTKARIQAAGLSLPDYLQGSDDE